MLQWSTSSLSKSGEPARTHTRCGARSKRMSGSAASGGLVVRIETNHIACNKGAHIRVSLWTHFRSGQLALRSQSCLFGRSDIARWRIRPRMPGPRRFCSKRRTALNRGQRNWAAAGSFSPTGSKQFDYFSISRVADCLPRRHERDRAAGRTAALDLKSGQLALAPQSLRSLKREISWYGGLAFYST